MIATVAAAAHVQSFSFGTAGDVESARLFLLPVSFQRAVGQRAAVDGYLAYGVGQVDAADRSFMLAAPVDSWVRVRWSLNPSVVWALGVALPTGLERHNSEQAVVASVLSNDLLGFREATWGSGGSATLGVSGVRQWGVNRVTSGASYKVVRPFEPSADTAVRYAPGNETRVRLGLERPMSAGILLAGFTFQHFGVDQADGRNIFRSGPRVRTDLTYSRPNWSVFFANLWRSSGDLTLPIINLLDGSYLRDTVFTVGAQNLAIVGANRTLSFPNDFVLVPNAEFKLKTRDERPGRGWLGSIGVAMPFSIGGVEYFPSAKLSRGSMIPVADPTRSRLFWGAEFSFVLRHATRAAQASR